MKTTKQRRPLYQVHLSTLMVQMLALSFFLFLQLVPTEVLQIEENTSYYGIDSLGKSQLRGWPEVFSITHTEAEPNAEEHFVLPKLRNIFLAVTILALLFYLQEAWLRRPKPSFTWVRGAIVVLLLSALTYGVVVARKEYVTHEFVSVRVIANASSDDLISPDWRMLQLYYNGACSWSDQRWISVDWIPALQKESQRQGYSVATGEHIDNVWVMPVISDN